jgi:putative transposase
MSNHWHGVLTDPDARLPEFLEIFHKLFAKAQNASLGRWEKLWSSDKTSVALLFGAHPGSGPRTRVAPIKDRRS